MFTIYKIRTAFSSESSFFLRSHSLSLSLFSLCVRVCVCVSSSACACLVRVPFFLCGGFFEERDPGKKKKLPFKLKP